MGSPNFRFKQFTVWHDRCAMKVGTDGVLLGAWCPLPINSSTYRVLDVGSGSGLITLMLAQRLSGIDYLSYTIDAIDIDADAVKQTMHNFELSPWAKHLTIYHSSFQDWYSNEQYDLIVSNPPYFQESLKNPDAQRATARHTDTLSYNELIQHAAPLLKATGTLALILPFDAKEEILSLAHTHGLHPTHITHVHSKPDKPAKRLLIAFSRMSNTQYPITNTMYIESENAPRSDEYKELTKDFYL